MANALPSSKHRVLAVALYRRRTRRDKMLPLCSHCKNIRDAEGRWHCLERHMLDAEGIEFTHGICPECLGTHYPPRERQKPA